MQSLSDLPNIPLKSDVNQMMFSQMPMDEIVPFASINGFWQNDWKIHLRTRSVYHIALEPNSVKKRRRKIYVNENGTGPLRRLFADTTMWVWIRESKIR